MRVEVKDRLYDMATLRASKAVRGSHPPLSTANIHQRRRSSHSPRLFQIHSNGARPNQFTAYRKMKLSVTKGHQAGTGRTHENRDFLSH